MIFTCGSFLCYCWFHLYSVCVLLHLLLVWPSSVISIGSEMFILTGQSCIIFLHCCSVSFYAYSLIMTSESWMNVFFLNCDILNMNISITPVELVGLLLSPPSLSQIDHNRNEIKSKQSSAKEKIHWHSVLFRSNIEPEVQLIRTKTKLDDVNKSKHFIAEVCSQLCLEPSRLYSLTSLLPRLTVWCLSLIKR